MFALLVGWHWTFLIEQKLYANSSADGLSLLLASKCHDLRDNVSSHVWQIHLSQNKYGCFHCVSVRCWRKECVI